jgi:predicted ABC-type exoprotein transport system permease subunit
MSKRNLRLSANSEEDLKVISAHLQDSITRTGNIAHLKKNRLFLIEFNRFMWEDIEKGITRKNKRVQSVLKFHNVLNVSVKNLNQKNKERFLDFLAIESKFLSDKSYEIKLHFAGNILIKMNVEVIDCFLDDQGEPWETKNMPKRDLFND